MIARLFAHLRSLWRDERGSSTVEFVIIFPGFLAIFLSSYESGLMMVRNVMLERGVDLAVRELRLGDPTPPTFDEFKALICDNALIGQGYDCESLIQVQLEPVDTATWSPLVGDVDCIDEGEIGNPLSNENDPTFIGGGNNELMLVRVCALYEPFFPGTTLGMQMPKFDGEESDKYALVVTSAYVNEPSR